MVMIVVVGVIHETKDGTPCLRLVLVVLVSVVLAKKMGLSYRSALFWNEDARNQA